MNYQKSRRVRGDFFQMHQSLNELEKINWEGNPMVISFGFSPNKYILKLAKMYFKTLNQLI